jgi:DNA-binding NtrC family response regulator
LLLATAFIKEFNKKFNKNVTGYTPEAANILQNYQWKGNIRELRNVIERIVLLETDNVITKESLHFLKPTATMTVTTDKPSIELKDGEHRLFIAKNGVTMASVLKDLIIQTLKITNGNQIKAAKILGVSRAKLRYRIEQLEINISGKSIN